MSIVPLRRTRSPLTLSLLSLGEPVRVKEVSVIKKTKIRYTLKIL